MHIVQQGRLLNEICFPRAHTMRHALLPAGLESLHSHLVPQPALMLDLAVNESSEAQLHDRQDT